MSRPSSIPSHPGPPSSYNAYTATHTQSSRPETIASNQHVRPRDPSGSQNQAPQLPSLRTLLEPELLDKRSSDPPIRLNNSSYRHDNAPRYGSSSPTLKRRHDFERYTHGYPEHNANVPQTSYNHRQPYPTANTDPSSAASSTPGSVFSTTQVDHPRRGSFMQPAYAEPGAKTFQLSSRISDPAGPHMNQVPHEDLGDGARPVRRRLDGSSRAPVRASICVGQREIPGEGMCYIYEDGTYCRAIIDGEPVNPSWGITKAGKPRKRLAQACLTCREKKIKCEPGYPKCHQCAKSQRICRGGLNQAGMSNASGETSPSSSAPLFKNPSTEVLHPAAVSDKKRAPGELREYSRKVETWNAGIPSKSRNFLASSFGFPRDMSVHSLDSDWSGSGNDQGGDDPRRGSYQDQLAVQWDQDPYETDPGVTIGLLDLYFAHAGRATYGMFPRNQFLSWVEGNREKTQDQLMLLYVVLALGSLFSSDPDKRALGKRFASVSAYAAEKRFGKFTLQLCQTRLMLGLYFFARGKSQEAWDYCGAGLRAISALKLNTEEGIRDLAENTLDLDYGFDRWTYDECCRRTFWSGLLMDRYNGFFGGTMFVISMEDTYIRLPCPADMYETSTPCEPLYFDEDLLTRRGAPSSSLGHMAYLCLISTIWGEVLTFTGRAVRRPNGYNRHYEAFYTRTNEKLANWLEMLPLNLRYNQQNLDESILDGSVGTFVSLHALYHAAIIRLNRHIRVEALGTDEVRRNVEESFRSASSVLAMMHSLAAVNRQQRLGSRATSELLFSTPFPGYALMLSIDVLTSTGTLSTLSSLIETVSIARSCVEELASFWASARSQQRAISSRLKHLTDIAVQEGQGVRNGTYGQFWKVSESLESTFGKDDAVYKAPDPMLFDVVAQLTSR